MKDRVKYRKNREQVLMIPSRRKQKEEDDDDAVGWLFFRKKLLDRNNMILMLLIAAVVFLFWPAPIPTVDLENASMLRLPYGSIVTASIADCSACDLRFINVAGDTMIGNLTFNDYAIFNSYVNISGNLTVTDYAVFESYVNITGDFNIGGETIFTSNITVPFINITGTTYGGLAIGMEIHSDIYQFNATNGLYTTTADNFSSLYDYGECNALYQPCGWAVGIGNGTEVNTSAGLEWFRSGGITYWNFYTTGDNTMMLFEDEIIFESNVTFEENVIMEQNLTVNVNDFFVDSSRGRVGIGTTTPDSELDIGGGDITNVNSIESGTGTAQPLRLYGRTGIDFVGDINDVNLPTQFYWMFNGDAVSDVIMELEEDGDLKLKGNIIVTGNVTASCMVLSTGGSFCGNTTSVWLTSPDGSTTLEVADA